MNKKELMEKYGKKAVNIMFARAHSDEPEWKEYEDETFRNGMFAGMALLAACITDPKVK